MSNLLCITSGITGVVNPACAMARRLQAAGHRVTFASPADIGATVTARGFDFVPLEAAPPRGALRGLRARLAHARAARRNPARALGVERLVETIERVAPDGLLIHVEMHAHILTLMRGTRPIGLTSPFLSLFEHPGVSPLHRARPPAPGFAGRLAAQWSWARFRAWKRWHAARVAARSLGSDRMSLLAPLARELGIDLEDQVDRRQWLIPFVYRRLPLLYLSPRELDVEHEPGPLEYHAGPMVDVDRVEPGLDAADEARLARLLDERAADGDRRLLLCSLSSFAEGSQGFLRRIIDAVRDEPGWTLAIGLGGRLPPDALGPLPPNVAAFSWIPQMRVLAAADVALTNAGPNSIVECVRLGVPMIVYSLDRNDQNGNAARVAHHRLGRVGSMNDGADRIRRDLHDVLDDEATRARVARMRGQFLHYDEEERTARAVETMLGLPRP